MLFSDKDTDNKTSKFNDFQPYKAEVISYGSKAVVSVFCSCDVCGFMCDPIEFLFDDKKASGISTTYQY